jgi:hypothetical protein
MILRRLTIHVKEQNWFAVALDFVIVIFGILIAFQITNWREAQQDNLIYEQARTRVIEEAKANLIESQNFTKRAVIYQNFAFEIFEDFASCTEDTGAKERLLRNMQPLRFILGIDVRKDAINLLLTSDEFFDNISPEDRTVLSVYAGTIATSSANSKFVENFSLTRPQLQDNPVFGRTIEGDNMRGLVALTLDVSYQQACKDKALNDLIFDRFELSNYLIVQAEHLNQASRELLVQLGVSVPETSNREEQP